MVGGDAADGYMPCGHGHRPHKPLLAPLGLTQSCYHPPHLSSNLTSLFGQEVCIGKYPTPMTALFVNPSSLLRVPFLPCLLGVASVPFISEYSPSTRGEDNPPKPLCCIPYARDASFSLSTILPFSPTKFYCLATISKSFLNYSPL